MYISWFPLVFIIRGTSSYFNSYFINYCGIRVLEKIRFQVFEKLQRLPISFFHRNQEGDLLSRMISDTGQLQAAILQVSNDLIKQPITFIGAITALIVMGVFYVKPAITSNNFLEIAINSLIITFIFIGGNYLFKSSKEMNDLINKLWNKIFKKV